MDQRTQLDDETLAGAYRECINQGLPLPDELIRWFIDKANDISEREDVMLADANLHVVSDFKLGYSPKRWHEILESEGAADNA